MNKEQHSRRMLPSGSKEPDEALGRFFLEERYRRSVELTGFLVSGAGAGAISCWFAVGNLYPAHAPENVLRLLVGASGVLLVGVVVGFLAALAGYKAFEIAAALPADQFNLPNNRADLWVVRANVARAVAAGLILLGGLTAFAGYLELVAR